MQFVLRTCYKMVNKIKYQHAIKNKSYMQIKTLGKKKNVNGNFLNVQREKKVDFAL